MTLRRTLPLAAALASVVAVVAVVALSSPALAGGSAGDLGTDVSNADCARLPASTAFGIVAVTGDPGDGGGRPFNANPCLKAESDWAAAQTGTPSLYVNTANPGPASTHWATTAALQRVPCASTTSATDMGCAYDYGWNAAGDALSRTSVITAFDPRKATWWLDVETANTWQASRYANTAVIQGYVERLRFTGIPSVGLYAASSHWTEITGGYQASVAADFRKVWASAFTVSYPIELGPTWVPGAVTAEAAATACDGSSFTGVAPLLAQYTNGDLLGDRQCRAESTDVTAPVARMTAPVGPVAITPFNVGWSSDGSGVSSYDVRYRRSPVNGPQTAFALPRSLQQQTRHAIGLAGPEGQTYCFSTRARDARANLSAWSAERCASHPVDDRSLVATSGWVRREGVYGHTGGTLTETTRAGQSLSLHAQAKHAWLLATTCNHCGTVGIYLNGSLLTTKSLYSATTHNVVIIDLGSFSFRSTTISVRVLSSGKTVQVDGIAASRV